MKQWETVTEIPEPAKGRLDRIFLEPGQIKRSPCGRSTAAGYQTSFKKQGRTDYHAIQRTVDGIRYLYIWRDPIEVKG